MSKRNTRPLLVTWIVTAAVVLVWWWLIRHIGIWSNLLVPAFPLLLLPALWRSWHWFHARRVDDRRDHDRRTERRRDGE